jgi:hypothetical protein
MYIHLPSSSSVGESSYFPPPRVGRIVKSYLPSPLGGEGQGEG